MIYIFIYILYTYILHTYEIGKGKRVRYLRSSALPTPPFPQPWDLWMWWPWALPEVLVIHWRGVTLAMPSVQDVTSILTSTSLASELTTWRERERYGERERDDVIHIHTHIKCAQQVAPRCWARIRSIRTNCKAFFSSKLYRYNFIDFKYDLCCRQTTSLCRNERTIINGRMTCLSAVFPRPWYLLCGRSSFLSIDAHQCVWALLG